MLDQAAASTAVFLRPGDAGPTSVELAPLPGTGLGEFSVLFLGRPLGHDRRSCNRRAVSAAWRLASNQSSASARKGCFCRRVERLHTLEYGRPPISHSQSTLRTSISPETVRARSRAERVGSGPLCLGGNLTLPESESICASTLVPAGMPMVTSPDIELSSICPPRQQSRRTSPEADLTSERPSTLIGDDVA